MCDSHMTPNEDKVERPLLHDTIVRLVAECIAHHITLNDVVRGATKGEIELLFHRPQVQPRTVLRPVGRDLVVGEPSISQMPDYLVLSQESCLQLLDRPSALVTHSHSGYRSRSANSYLTHMPASEAGQSKMFPVQVDGKDFSTPETKFGFWGSWALWSDAGPFQYAVRPDDVFVRKGEFDRWRLEYCDLRAARAIEQTDAPQVSTKISGLGADSPEESPSLGSRATSQVEEAVAMASPAISKTKKRRSKDELGEIEYFARQHGNAAAAKKFGVGDRYIRKLRANFGDIEAQKEREKQEHRPSAELQSVWAKDRQSRS